MGNSISIISLLALLFPMGLFAADPTSPELCLECHDYGEDSPVHQVLLGSHGMEVDEQDMAGRRGCLDCHGDSAAHADAPRSQAPDVSFGPRWSASSGDQDAKCLNCHEQGAAANWRHALHMHNNLTCVTCHDIHSEQDKVLVQWQQSAVCTMCHKAQKQGIHGLQGREGADPPCIGCHNPHDHESARAEMLKNRSAGCTACHDLQQMADDPLASDKAENYHRVMADPARTCIDCHQGVTHAPADSAPPIHPTPVRGRTVTLFYPGMIDSSWLAREHPGSQPLRQGTACQRCHRGEEAAMGQALAGTGRIPYREIGLAFSRSGDMLELTLTWEGPADDSSLALMWGDGSDRSFERGGCFGACHSDRPGMKAAVEGVELWQVDLSAGSLRRARVLDRMHWLEENLTEIKISRDDGLWRVALRRKLNNNENGISFILEGRYTLGISLNTADMPGNEHWVSLPMTLSFGGNDTDFTAEKE